MDVRDYKESWAPKNWCFWTVVLEKTLESPLDCKEIQPVHPKADQSWVFIGRTEAEAENPIFWSPHEKRWLIRKDLDAGWNWGLGGEGDDRGWDGWMASPTRWAWVWVNSGTLWWTGRPGVLQFMESQRVGHNSATELNWTDLSFFPLLFPSLLFTSICKAYSDSHFAFLHLFFLGMVLLPVSCTVSWTSVHCSSGTLSIRSSPLNLFLTSTV